MTALRSYPADVLLLPVGVVSRIDVNRLLREVAAVDEAFRQSGLRTPGQSVTLPRTSRMLDEFVRLNNLNLLHEADRTLMQNFLISVRSKGPLLHISFAVDPSPRFLQQIVSRLREEIHPMVLVQIGLQPGIGAGCIVRTANKYFDFSLQHRFTAKRQLLLDTLHAPQPTGAPTAEGRMP